MPSITASDPAVRVRATVKWFRWKEPDPQKNFGFLTMSDGRDVHCHSKNVRLEDHGLEEGDQVDFLLTPGSQGRPTATDVRRVNSVLPANFKFPGK